MRARWVAELGPYRPDSDDVAESRTVRSVATTRELLGRHSGTGGVQSKLAEDAMPVAGGSPTTEAEAWRSALLTRAELLDPANAGTSPDCEVASLQLTDPPARDRRADQVTQHTQ